MFPMYKTMYVLLLRLHLHWAIKLMTGVLGPLLPLQVGH